MAYHIVIRSFGRVCIVINKKELIILLEILLTVLAFIILGIFTIGIVILSANKEEVWLAIISKLYGSYEVELEEEEEVD